MTYDINSSAGGPGSAPDASIEDNSAKVERDTTTSANIKQKLSDDVSSAKDYAREKVSEATDHAKDAADQQKKFIAGKMSGVAMAIEKVADELEQGDDRDIAKLARTLGSTMKTFSDDMQDRSLGEMAGKAEDFGRQQPLAFLGLAAIAGLAASRFLTASATHRPTGKPVRQPTGQPADPGPVEPAPADPSYATARPVASMNETSTEGRING
ncbi:nutrient deprivation-induced protein [Rhizobium skierniewicense]|uniref:nutrient deprivation-induced protein n=1 Tax=Rhizobium skierniewicense TaxID=984260 RepID=UPI00157368DB|nr:nutrient deprivation-induced protein [Rhizobium skierniewicense]NTF34458.1 nutrient deprivation-induced protein [Rhizobium skierniewicense]